MHCLCGHCGQGWLWLSALLQAVAPLPTCLPRVSSVLPFKCNWRLIHRDNVLRVTLSPAGVKGKGQVLKFS